LVEGIHREKMRGGSIVQYLILMLEQPTVLG